MALLLTSNCRSTYEYGAFFTIYGFLTYAGRFLKNTGSNLNLYFEILRLLVDAHGRTSEALEFLPSYLLHDPNQPTGTSSQLQSLLEVYFRRTFMPWPGADAGYWLDDIWMGLVISSIA